MPAMQTIFSELNRMFGRDHIRTTAQHAEKFAPGARLDVSFAIGRDRVLGAAVQAYIDGLPSGVREMLRAVAYHALTAKTPKPVTFAWAPGYDAEITVWDVPDTKATQGGMTVLLKSRYPSDTHPVPPAKGKGRSKA